MRKILLFVVTIALMLGWWIRALDANRTDLYVAGPFPTQESCQLISKSMNQQLTGSFVCEWGDHSPIQ